MNISREDQKEFARQVFYISERDASPETLNTLSKLVSLLVSWVSDEEENGIAINLSEYIGELKEVVNGGEDTGWKDEFKKTLLEDLEE
jgi:hypothetical protein